MKYPAEEIVSDCSVLVRGEYDMIESFANLKFKNVENAVFKIDWVSPAIDTLFCNEIFKRKAEHLKVLGVEFISLDGNGSEQIIPV